MVGYADNHTSDTYKLYRTDTKRVIMTRNVKWADRKMTDPAETMNIFHEEHKEYLALGIEEDIITTSELEDNMTVHVIPDNGKTLRQNKNSENL